MIVKSRSEIRTLVSRRARIVDHLNSHAAASLNIDLDDSYRTVRDFVTEKKWGTYLKTTGALSMASLTVPSNEEYASVPVPTDCRLVKKLETKTGTRWIPAEEVPFGQLRIFNTTTAQGVRSPFAWTMLDQGMQATRVGNDGTLDAGSIALFPQPTGGNYQLWYLPEHADLTADSGAGGFYAYGNQAMLDMHVYHTALKCVVSDNDSQGIAKGLTEFLNAATRDLENGAPTATGPKTWRRARDYW